MYTISFYIIAHADDWQLFMFPHCYDNLMDKSRRNVFIFTTAGDAGFGFDFCRAREEAAKKSVVFCFPKRDKVEQKEGRRQANGHKIAFWEANNACYYFLRLPDGGLDGAGFGKGSLTLLQKEQIDEIVALDNSSTYYGWEDLVKTLKVIITRESSGYDQISLHYLNPSPELNPNDHPDHVATGQAMNEVELKPIGKRFLYRGYSTSSEAARLKTINTYLKKALFSTYEKTLFQECGYNTLAEDPDLYDKWLSANTDYRVWRVHSGLWHPLKEDWLSMEA